MRTASTIDGKRGRAEWLKVALLLVGIATGRALADYPCANGFEMMTQSWVEPDGSFANFRQVCTPKATPTAILWQPSWNGSIPTPAPTLPPPTPQPTYAYTAPTPQPTFAYVAPTAQPTYAYVAPTPQPTPARFTAVYDPASLAAATTRCDTVTVTGIVTSKALAANPGVNPATGCDIAAVRPSAADTVTVCWRNVFAATTACDTASSTWLFSQP